MQENGFFCLLLDKESEFKLRQAFPDCKFPHLSVLVINDPAEIAHMKDVLHSMEKELYAVDTNDDLKPVGLLEPIVVNVSGLHTLKTRGGETVKVLKIQEDLTTVKLNLMERFGIVSDIYGAKQKFHITVGTNLEMTPKNPMMGDPSSENGPIPDNLGELKFIACVFSVRSIKMR